MDAKIEPTRAEQLAELSVFLLLIIPSIALSFFAHSLGQAGFVIVAVSTIFRNLALTALILFFLWRNGEPASILGWAQEKFTANLGLGLLLAPLVTSGVAALAGGLETLGLSGPQVALSFLEPRGSAQLALGVVLVAVVAVSEETIFRGYLIARITSISESLPLAVGLSSLVFALGHAYEGAAGVLAVGAMGLCFALLLVWRRSLVAPVVIHFVNNFLAIVLIPMLLR